jgi:hypothetical protein
MAPMPRASHSPKLMLESWIRHSTLPLALRPVTMACGGTGRRPPRTGDGHAVQRDRGLDGVVLARLADGLAEVFQQHAEQSLMRVRGDEAGHGQAGSCCQGERQVLTVERLLSVLEHHGAAACEAGSQRLPPGFALDKAS